MNSLLHEDARLREIRKKKEEERRQQAAREQAEKENKRVSRKSQQYLFQKFNQLLNQ